MIIVSSCGVPQSDYDKLILENEKLKEELDEYKFGADRIIALVEKAYNEKNYTQARHNIELLYSKHPESPKNEEFKKLLKVIERKEAEVEKRRKVEEKERIRLANINNLGIWQVGYYVDNFGDPTNEGYIRNKILIRGSFSNTATQNSALDVKFLISNSRDISIMLYEYARNNPVKAVSSDSYTVRMKDSNGNKITLRAVNYSDRLGFNKTDSRKVHNILLRGGRIQF